MPDIYCDSLRLREGAICFSVQVDKDLKKLSARFNARVSEKSLNNFKQLKEYEGSHSPEDLKQILGLKRKPSSHVFKGPDEEGRIYPGYFAPVIVSNNGEREIEFMRYRVRPKNSVEEIPSKYNVFNARYDSLTTRRTWSSIFLKNHALFPFKHFYEWVERDSKKKLVRFKPQKRDLMWAPAIFDDWASADNEIHFKSFALITTDPPKEIEEQGHDRCPIFLNETLIDQWLEPQKLKEDTAKKILRNTEVAQFELQT